MIVHSGEQFNLVNFRCEFQVQVRSEGLGMRLLFI